MGAIRSSLLSLRGRHRNPRVRTLLWAALAALVIGTIQLGQPLEDSLRIARNALRERPASGEIVLVAVDEKSLAALEEWPWPRRYYAEAIERLFDTGARHVTVTLEFSGGSRPAEDEALEQVLRKHQGRVTLATRLIRDGAQRQAGEVLPPAQFARHGRLASPTFRYNYQGAVWTLPRLVDSEEGARPTLAAAIAGQSGGRRSAFPVDYAIEPRTIPVISFVDLLDAQAPPSTLRGKSVVIGNTAAGVGEAYFMPGYGRMPAVYVHLLGAETLIGSNPVRAGWTLPFLLALLICGLASAASRARIPVGTALLGTFAMFGAALWFDAKGIQLDIVPALLLFLFVAAARAWRSFRDLNSRRAHTNAVSGLPNLQALREEVPQDRRILVAARVQNYAEICTTLTVPEEQSLAEQVAGRLSIGSSDLRLHQGDEGIFAWLAPIAWAEHMEEHLDALQTVFRMPVLISGRPIDLSVSFGVERSFERSLSNRLGSALVAADDAASMPRRWKIFDPETLRDAPWKLSILSQLDAAMDAGDVWVAYQPILDLRSRRTVGAEALVRWSHPEKGPIAPVEFVPAAEQNGRIGTLTEFVLERAIRGAAFINGRGIDFSVAVNLSAKLLDELGLDISIAGMLDRYRLSPKRLTLEVTETAALASGTTDIEPLQRLRQLGVRISIDDYGTGMSTLEYLRIIPATEIKIDRSFVQSIYRSQGDRLMVHSTIQLAHSLGQRVVAEGVEDAQTLDALRHMGCDLAQGFFIGRPVPFRDIVRSLRLERTSRAA